MSKNLICYDSMACIRCYSCMVNCSVENKARAFRDKNKRYELAVNETNKSYCYLTPEVFEYGKFPNARKITKFQHCNHCDNAPCKNICPTKAIQKRKNGIVVIHNEVCVGCRSCIDACPFDVPKYDSVNNKSYKCIGCYDRVENGLKQSCVEACPTNSMFSGSYEEVKEEVLKRIERYESVYGEKFIAYGLDQINGYVGGLGWVTIVPEKELEAYKLSETPHKNGMILRDLAKKGAPVLIGGAFVATGIHFLYWLANRKKVLKKSSSEEE